MNKSVTGIFFWGDLPEGNGPCNTTYLVSLDTFGFCQRPVFSLDVSQHMHKSCKRIMTEKHPRCRICVLSDASGLKYYFSETTTSFSKTIRNFRGKPSFSPFCLCSSMLESLILLCRSIAKLIQQNMTASNANVKTMTSEVIP